MAGGAGGGGPAAGVHDVAGRDGGGHRPVRRESGVYHKIVAGLWEALADTGGVAAQLRGALERVHLLMGDWRSLLARLADAGERMTAVLDELGLTELVTSIDGLSAAGAAVILAETGELPRFASARPVVKHAGLNPSEHTPATLAGKTRISHRGRPGLSGSLAARGSEALPRSGNC